MSIVSKISIGPIRIEPRLGDRQTQEQKTQAVEETRGNEVGDIGLAAVDRPLKIEQAEIVLRQDRPDQRFPK